MRQEWQRRSGVVGWALAITALLIAVPRVASATVVVPNAQTAVEGNANNAFPFNCFDFSASMRYQQVYLGSEVGIGRITEIRFRKNGDVTPVFGPTTFVGVTITLSSTPKIPDGLVTTFANNVGADVTTVFSGNLTLSTAATTDSPQPFDIVIPLQTPFPFNAATGLNLLLDVTIPTCPDLGASPILDAQTTSGDSVSRVHALDSSSATGSTSTLGLITQFIGVSTSIPTLSEWAMIGMVLILAGIAVWRLRRRPAISV